MSPEPTRNSDPGRWIPVGETVRVAGLTIEGGMFYLGGVLNAPKAYGPDNCLVNPSLRVAGDNPDVLGETMGYWPSYSSITPRARLAYLQWLAGGRRDPAVGIGYIFLFFYGLERRAFVDGAVADLAAMTAEVRRLLETYGGNASFRSYARRFIEMAEVADLGEQDRPELRPDLRDGFEIPVRVRIWLGKRLASGDALDADDALMWVLALPDTAPRTAVTRCFPEFRALWTSRFLEKWSAGLAVAAPETELRVTYRPASGTFAGEIAIQGLPDIGVVTRPLKALRRLFEACTDDLDAYSRLLGRKPDARSSLEAALLLPKALCDSEHAGRLPVLRAELETLIGAEGITTVATEKILGPLGLDDAGAGRPALMRQAGACLDLLGVGFEPDRRFGGSGPTDATQLVIFRQAAGACDAEGIAFAAARTMVEVAALAAAADGVVVPTEFEAISSDLQALEGLTRDERTRLLAYALALLKNPPKQQAVLGKLAKSPIAARAEIARSALSAVLADGRVTPEEVKYLERLNKALGLPQEDVYSALHRGAVRVDEPVLVAAEVRERGAAIPRQRMPSDMSVALDLARINRIREETTAVSSLLAEIFADEAHPEVPPPPLSKVESVFSGLDAAHGELLSAFLEAESWSWEAFEGRARALRLLPEGALETINEWAFDRFDEPLLEGGELVVAAAHLRPKLQDLGVIA